MQLQSDHELDYQGFEATQEQLLASTQENSKPQNESETTSKQTFVTYAFETTFQPSAWYECLQELDCEEYSGDQVERLKQLFEANQEQLEKFKQLQAAQSKQAQSNIARKTVKIQSATVTQVSQMDGGQGEPSAMVDEGATKDNMNMALAARTRQRLTKYGIL